ncbi:MAG: SBBP repeat-containing protein [Candidatus Syntrophosphaera sp.]|nr:SBBP repeat-containing protein [Candidatus Syntrophosphaera sp.]
MRGFLFCAAFALVALGMSAQAPDWVWAVRAGDIGHDRGHAIAVDSQGNQYVTGLFWGSVEFGSVTLISADNYDSDMFVCKLDSAGNFLWAVSAGGIGHDRGTGIAVDSAGYVYVTGIFTGAVFFGPFHLSSGGGSDIFVAKLDQGGNWLWAVRAGGPDSMPDYYEDQSYGIAVDGAGNAFVTGQFLGSASFGSISLSSSGTYDYDIFVAKLDAGGNWVWAQRAGGSSWDRGRAVALDSSGNVYLTGYINGSADFGDTVITAAGSYDIFAAKLDQGGDWLWAVRAGGAWQEWGSGIAVGPDDEIYLTGTYHGPANFGSIALPETSVYKNFAAKMDAGGNFLWAREVGGLHTQNDDSAIAVDGWGNVCLTGVFWGTASFGATSFTSYGYYDLFAAKMDSNGNWLWARRAGGPEHIYGIGIAVDAASNAYLTGFFFGSVAFGPIGLTADGPGSELFIAKLYSGVPVEDELVSGLAGLSSLSAAWPNPFRQGETANITACVAKGESGILSVHNLRGELIFRRELGSGEQQISLDSRDLASGVYLCRLRTPSGTQVRKLVLIR